MKRLTGILLIAALIFSGCGGSGSKKRTSEEPTLPSLKPGPIITVATGSDDLAPDHRYPLAVASFGVSPESSTAGDSIIVWTTGKTLHGAMYSGSSAKLTSMTLTSTIESNPKHLAPSVAAEKDGTFTVVWDNGGIIGHKFNANGNPVGSAEVFSKTGKDPDFVLGKDGKIIISCIGTDRRIHLITKTKKQEMKDMIVGEDLTNMVTDKEKEIYFLPNVDVDDGGNILVVWQETPEARGNMAEAPVGHPNFGARIDPAGKVTEKDIRIDRTAPSRMADFPAVFGLSSGWVVAWKDMNAVDSQQKLTFYNAKGEPTGAAVRVDTSGKAFTSPGMARDRDGNILVVWTDYRSGNPEVYGRLMNGTGTQMGPEMKMGDGLNPRITFNGKGFQAVWTAATPTHTLNTIYLRDLVIEL